MTAVLNLEEKINQVKKTLLEVPEEEQNGKMANVMRQNLAKYEEELKSQTEKKNEAETIAAAEVAIPTERAVNNALDRVINVNPNLVIPIEINSSGVEDEKYFFTSLAAAQKYHHYRNRLRSKLHYWQHKKNKNEGAKEEMLVMCSFFIAQIASIIQYYCKSMHQDRLFKKKYSLGEKDNDKTYCFDMEKLRKDFDF
jgi:hypothetical protein